MSKVKIEGNASGTGTLTISAPNTNTDRTLTLPDGAGEILTDASTLSSSNLSGALPALDGSALTGIGGGKVLQVVIAENTTQLSTTDTSVTDTGLEVDITPSSTSSKILVQTSFISRVSVTDCDQDFYLTRWDGSTNTDLAHIFPYIHISTGVNDFRTVSTITDLDSPATTSEVTYKLRWRTNSGRTLQMNLNSSRSSIIAMEIDGS